MRLQPGQILACYRLVGKIGEGGMGEVWKAVDTGLDREVAIKILPAAFAEDRERLARFEREARVLASLSDTRIAGIYGLHEHDGIRFLAMEYVPGEDLAERLQRGPLPLEDALEIARQVAAGLRAAHDQGIVHRDLKPANLRLDGEQVKILDFGLAKAMETAEADSDLTRSPTLTLAATREGVILGTAAYMSPEQARGKTADRRSDVWSFGVVLYEMLTGRRLFAGETVSDVLAAVLRAEPDWGALPPDTPAAVRRLLRRCLERDAARRLRDMGDAGLEIDEALAGESEAAAASAGGPAAARRRPGPWPFLATAAAAALATFLVTLALRHEPAPPPVRRLAIAQAGFHAGSSVAISPDGSHIAYSTAQEVGRAPLRVLALDSYETRVVSGTQGASNPFFSPDSHWLAYATAAGLSRVALEGGSPEPIMAATSWDVTGDWLPDGRMVLSRARVQGRSHNGLAILTAPGAEPTVLTTPGRDERLHARPRALPDGLGVLFQVIGPGGHSLGYVGLDGGPHKILIDDASTARYLPRSGLLLFYRPSTQNVLAVGFDPEKAVLTGSPTAVLRGVLGDTQGHGSYDVARDGTLIYTSAAEDDPMLGVYKVAWVDREGHAEAVLPEPGSWAQPRISPDGRQLLVRHTATPNCDLWTYDLERGALSRVTFEGDNHAPLWHPSGRTVTFGVEDVRTRRIVSRAADGTGEDMLVSEGEFPRWPSSWSGDGRLLAFVEDNDTTGYDIWVLDTTTGEEAPFLATPFQEGSPAFSPDGRWLAYVSNESGQQEVYLRPHGGDGGKIQVSNSGGKDPLWRADGRELFYVQTDRLMSVALEPGDELRPGAPRELFGGPFIWQRAENLDVAADGSRFVMIEGQGDLVGTELRVVLNWFQELRRLAPPED